MDNEPQPAQGETVNFGLSFKDWTRIVWTFVQALLGYATAAAVGWLPGQPWNWKGFVVGGVAAGWSAVKNFILSDQSNVK